MADTATADRAHPALRGLGERIHPATPGFLRFSIGFTVACAALYLLVIAAVAPMQTPRALSVTALMVLACIAGLFLRAGRVNATVVTMSAGLWSYVTTTSFFFGGVDGTAIIVYVPIILLVGWLIGARASVYVAGATVAATLGFVVAEMTGVLPTPPPTPPLVRWVAQSSVFVLSAVLLLNAVRSYRERLAEVHALSAALEQRTADLDRAQAVAHVGSWVYDLRHDVMYLSPETCRIFGLPEGTTGSRASYLSRVHPDDRDRVSMAWQVAQDASATFDHEHRIVHRDGVRWIRQIAAFERASDGMLARSVGTTQDITARRVAEAALHEKEVHLEGVLASTADGILAVDREGRVIQTNRRFAELWRIPVEVVSRGDDRALLDHVVGQLRDPEAFLAKVQALYHSDAELTDAVEFTDGRVFERFTAPLVLNGTNVGRVWSFRDITERTRAERALLESRNLLQTVIDTAPVRVFWKDRDLRYLGCNPALAHDAGLAEPAEVIGKSDHDFGWAEQADAYRADDRAVMASGRAKLSYEEQQTTPDGRQIWLRTSKVPLLGHGNETIGILGVYEDITERKRVEQRLAMAIDVTGVVLWEVDLVSGALSFDPTMLPILGLSAADPPRDLQTWASRIHADDRAAFGAALEAAMQAGDPVFDLEYRLLDGGGGYQWVQTRGRVAQRTPSGAPLLAVGTSVNTSAQRLAQETLRQSEERSRTLASMLRRMCDNVPDMIWAKDLDGRYLFANRAMCEQLLGAVDTAEPEGKTDLFFAQRERAVHPDDPGWHTYGEQCRDTDAATLEQRATCVFEEAGNVKGTRLVLDVHKSPFIDEQGRVIGTVGSARDVTSRRAADLALRESEQRLAAVFNASPIGITITRMSDGTVLDANEAALRLYGFTREAAVGMTGFDLGIYDEPAQRDALLRELRGAGTVDRYPVRLRNRSGDVRDVELAVRAIELQGEACMVVMMLDVTERKRLEQAHLQAQKLAALGTLAGGIAHDFNNILMAIRGNTELAADEISPHHPAAECLGEIRRASMRASDLVRRIMAFGRPKDAQHEVVDLAVVVTEVLKLLRSTLPASLTLATEFGPEAPPVLADAGQVHEAIVNLTTNAAHAIGQRAGTITYRLGAVLVDEAMARGVPGLAPGPHARLVVRDDGCGIGADALERVFDAFYTTKPVGEGTGLGLSMVHGIMRSHNGAVTVESTPQRGSTFTLYFPAAGHQAPSREPSAGNVSRRLASGRVLFVDDESGLVSLATRALSRLGYEVSGFTDAREALEAFRAAPAGFDIVITDLAMPQLSGFDIAHEVLALRPGMAVLMTTGYVGPDDEARARSIGIRRLVMKPFGVDQLAAALSQLSDPT